MNVKIDPEFHALIPPLSDDERTQLETNLKADGCRDPLVHWRGLLLDGHNRYEICDRLGIGYRMVEKALPDRAAATAWIIRNQLGRRNLSDFQRAELALRLKPVLSADAKQRMTAGKASDPAPNVAQGQRNPDTRKVLAEAAGVSPTTIQRTETIAARAAEPVKQLAREGKVSVAAAAAVATLPKREQAKVAAEGPKAVQAKAKEIREQKEPAAPVGAEPWGEFEAGINEVVATLRSASRRLGEVLEYDAATKQLKSRWAHFYSHAGTVGQVNAIVRGLLENLPAEKSSKPPGFLPARVVKARKSAAEGR